MQNLQFTGKLYGEKITIKQVQKRTAKKLFEKGLTVYIQTSNFCPFGSWSNCFDINKEKHFDAKFETYINEFQYYNCNNESGLYTHFYVSI